jgi:hypothetical protein
MSYKCRNGLVLIYWSTSFRETGNMKSTTVIAALCALFVVSAGAITASYATPSPTTKIEKKKPKPATKHKKPKLSI